MIDRETILKTLQCNPIEYPKLLESKFPHVLEKIVCLWGSPEAEDYFTDLLQPNGRGGGRMDRDGFPDQVWQEILHLKVQHNKLHPQ